ncbi:MAG: hypothetical protein EOM25_13265 [Deltaproteobacteria bacterium]|nr:hypothetical protein [Deltaproteobacteria bacterium]
MHVDLASLDQALQTAGLPVEGVAYYTELEAQAAHVPVGPVWWHGSVRLDVTRDLDEEEQVEAAGIIEAWAEDL